MRRSTRYVLFFLTLFIAMRIVPGFNAWVWNFLDVLLGQLDAGFMVIPTLVVSNLWIVVALPLCYFVGRLACASRTLRRILDDVLTPRKSPVSHVGFQTDRRPLLDEQDFSRIIAELANPNKDERPEQPVDPTPRALTDGAWSTWDEAPQWRNGLPALDRSFTLRTDCQSGHVAEHHVAEHWQEAGTGQTRVTRVCRFVCHSTWSEIA